MKKLDIVRKYWGIKTHAEIAQLCGSTPKLVSNMGRRIGLPHTNRNSIIIKDLNKDITISNNKNDIKIKDDKLKIALLQIAKLQKTIDIYEKISDISPTKIEPHKSSYNGATAFAVASDWHYWETVHPEQVNYLNEFNKTIAEKRAQHFFSNSEKLLSIFNKHSKIENLVLPLLGDFISGNIHKELLESNQGLIIDELIAVQTMIASGIEHLIKTLNKDTTTKIIIPCHYGNHGRITEKTHISTAAGNSLEYLMYHNLANYFKGEDRIQFNISRGDLSYLDINGFTVRFHHGDAIKYGGGIGGIFIPAFKAISQWDKAKRADLDVFGHFHQCRDGGKFVTNGSLVGYNDFALKIKADYEKPKQLFFLIDHNRKEKTTTLPIFLD